ncbi:MAG: hypothetical protein AB1706_10190 [Pseudomonadota bacterium]
MPDRPIPVDVTRTAIIIGYQNNEFIADLILPYSPVNGEKFSYWKHRLADEYTIPNTKVGRRSKPNKVSFAAEEVTKRVVAHGLEDFIPQSDIDAAVSYDPVNRTVLGIASILKRAREKRVADMVMNSDNYTTNKKVLTAAERFDTASTGLDPVVVFEAALDAMLVPPTHLALSRTLWNYLRKHDSVTTALYGESGKGKRAKAEDFASEWGLKGLLIGTNKVNTAKKGQTPSFAGCWPNSMLLFRQDNEDPNDSTYGKTFRYGEPAAKTRVLDDSTGLTGGVEVWAGEFIYEDICSEQHGYLITGPSGTVIAP